MKHFSARNPSANKRWLRCHSLCLGILILLGTAAAIAAPRSHFDLDIEARLATHLNNLNKMSSHRYTFDAEHNTEYSKQWALSLGLRAQAETIYGFQKERYGEKVRDEDSLRIFPRDIYLQYRNGPWQIRTGYQQVVWGEAFGAYFADIVNPKDLRELALDDLSDLRQTSPLVNIQWIRKKGSIQLLYAPFPQFNIMPVQGSEFFEAFATEVPGVLLNVEPDPRDTPRRGEYGGRVSLLLGSLDLSLFHFDYIDRTPVYETSLALTTPPVLHLFPEHRPLKTSGLTFTTEVGPFLLRGEALIHKNRSWNTVVGNNLTEDQSDETLFVLGVDYTRLTNWELGIQYSESHLDDKDYFFREPKQSLIMSRLARGYGSDHKIELLGSYYSNDGSALLQLRNTNGVAPQIELVTGIDWFIGNDDSQFGRLNEVSRVYIALRGFLRD